MVEQIAIKSRHRRQRGVYDSRVSYPPVTHNSCAPGVIRSLTYMPLLLFVFLPADLTEGVPFVQDLSGGFGDMGRAMPSHHASPMPAHHDKTQDHHCDGNDPPPVKTVPECSVSIHKGYLPSFSSTGSQTSTFLSSTSKVHFSSRIDLNFLRARCRRTFTFSTVRPRISAIS